MRPPMPYCGGTEVSDHLFSPQIVAHCFFAPRCGHVVTGTPQWAHDEMERHYGATHRADIDHASSKWKRNTYRSEKWTSRGVVT